MQKGVEITEFQGDYSLTAEQIISFQQNGHILLRGVASAEELAVYAPAIRQAAAKYSTETRPLAERDTYGKAFLQVTELTHITALAEGNPLQIIQSVKFWQREGHLPDSLEEVTLSRLAFGEK